MTASEDAAASQRGRKSVTRTRSALAIDSSSARTGSVSFRLLDDRRIAVAEESLRSMLERDRLDGLTFLDAGSGSGLFSLAARRLGARVTSFDFDPQSVACTAELRRRYFADDDAWVVLEGSVLDESFVSQLGRFDIVYSWGVLHHTGSMWRAIELAQRAVAPGGRFFIALYNDQGLRSVVWRNLKRLYCSGFPGVSWSRRFAFPISWDASSSAIWRGAGTRSSNYREYRANRGMSLVRDWSIGSAVSHLKCPPRQPHSTFFAHGAFGSTGSSHHARSRMQ
jgi:2-polyprenyl-6-hydroxyphenyl methylase/3-demethylubiquinone-9 3-methyltransferase